MNSRHTESKHRNPELYLPEEHFNLLKGATLFYLCSGRDILEPITVFASVITDFWFIDITYHNRHGLRSARSMLSRENRFQFLGSEQWEPEPTIKESGSEEKQQNYPRIEPLVVTETYLDLHHGSKFNVHLQRNDGVTALRKVIKGMSVFFYRGDGIGEGGSGIMWLDGSSSFNFQFQEVLQKLENRGLVVTDGCNCPDKKSNPYRYLGSWSYSNIPGEKLMREATNFIDQDGRIFQCIGYLGQRNGPTLIWQVKQTD